MKLFCIFLVVCVFTVSAQRRPLKPDEADPSPKPLRRGRTRFVANLDQTQVDELQRSEPSHRRTAARRRPSEQLPEKKSQDTIKRNYEVEEVVDDTPAETLLRRPSKPRTYTEVKFEATNAPPSALFQPSTTESVEDIIKSIGSDILDHTPASVAAISSTSPQTDLVDNKNSLQSASEIVSTEVPKVENEIRRTQSGTTPSATSSRNSDNSRRRTINGRSRANNNTPTTGAPETRTRATRTRATRKPEETSSTPARAVHRTVRKRPVEHSTVETPQARTRGPSVLASSATEEIPSRTRTGRKIPGSRQATPEKITLDLTKPTRSRGASRRSFDSASSTEKSYQPRGSSLRSRSRDIPPVIDEQKLEVLPLFEAEAKTVRTTPRRSNNNVKFVSRRRNFNSAEEVQTSATENEIKSVAAKTDKAAHTTSKPKVIVSKQQSVVIETRTESSIKRRKPSSTSKPQIVEQSVISEVSEVTSKRTVPLRKPALKSKVKVSEPKVSVSQTISRGVKKSEVKLSEVKPQKSLTSSEEDIDESDNYPPQFKALLQAKKHHSNNSKESRPALPTITKTTEKVVTSSAAPTTTTTTTSKSSEAAQLEDSENEVVAKILSTTASPLRPTRRKSAQQLPSKAAEKFNNVKPAQSRRKTVRSSTPSSIKFQPKLEESESTPGTVKIGKSNKIVRSSTTASPNKFHQKLEESESTPGTVKVSKPSKIARPTTISPAKFHSKLEESESTPPTVKIGKPFSPKPRGLYSSRSKTTKEPVVKSSKSSSSHQVPLSSIKKSNRFSSRYRHDSASRSSLRTSTNAPAYLPTIPTIRAPTTSEYVWPEEENIEYSWSFSRLN